MSGSNNHEQGEPPGDSNERQMGRRLILKFVGSSRPELYKAEFRYNNDSKNATVEQGVDNLLWTSVPHAFSLLCLDYFYHNSHSPHERFLFRGPTTGDLPATLSNARYTDSSFLHDLFSERPKRGGRKTCLKEVIKGKAKGSDFNYIDDDFLPADCLEIYWDALGAKALEDPADVKRLADTIRISLKLPVPKDVKSVNLKARTAKSKTPEISNPSAPVQVTMPESFLNSLSVIAKGIFGIASKDKSAAAPESKPKPAEESKKTSAAPNFPELTANEIRQAKIDPTLFRVQESGKTWPDEMPLIAWGDDDNPYLWTLKNAFEGVLILGATGSGKTSGSGAALAESYLRAGFGGLVMTVKPDEAERWRRLCARCGREQDFVVVRRGGNWKLNALAYASQAPSRGAGLAANLVAFCRTLLSISSRHQGKGTNEQFWETASAQLLNATFDLFLLSSSELSFDGLSNFIAAAPTESIPSDEEGWFKLSVFGAVLEKARQGAASDEDKRILQRAMSYWMNIYPSLASKTRSSITLSVYAMLDAFRGRDIPALIASETNLTPESIMSGKIVVLDLPLKEMEHTGLILQSAWKYLFQTALERQSRSGNPKHRPVFLWEDEGQYLASQYDHQFQATARSSRVSHVILSQNIHNFYQEFGTDGHAAANSLFGNLNTKIFHANSDPESNLWGAKILGQVIRPRLTINHNQAQPQSPSGNLADSFLRALNPPSQAGISTTEQWEFAVRPEEFNCLRTGGPENDFQVDAYITWIAGAGANQKHFTHITFVQTPNT